ncbi:MAG: UDP-N-acetylglucosamine 2-epimerase (hydrolyzing) [Muribaculaceae bacterium]|nr:UDP-N-acetylglucosamine 2-epimerase (hydrolyzing) [Muribaculaceae bacterium]MDE6321843.1 UDP-N-acetylglucosamine 2-epimerase (hydrolyzing) [Muribaculaceae bacterium]
MKRSIAIITGTRADWGLLSPIATALRAHPHCDVSIIATNMHLEAKFGHTVDDIEADSFRIAARVPLTPASDSPVDTAVAMGECESLMARALYDLMPDMVVILGDRYEMLAAASAATLLRIPIVHLHGGEETRGAIDDNIRHAITQLSQLHLTSTEPYRQRVIAMGKAPASVVNTGAIGVYNMLNTPLLSRREVVETLDGWDPQDSALLVTLHPATADDTITSAQQAAAMFEALDRFPQCRLLITYPNNDPDHEAIIEAISEYVRRWGDRVKVVPSLGWRRYLSALRCVKCVVGNSSSGIIEVPSAGIPTVDIGMRQQGRIAAKSVINCQPDADSIAAAIDRALSAEMQQLAAECHNPYMKPDTLRLIVDAITSFEV